jgi:hypothetical protein
MHERQTKFEDQAKVNKLKRNPFNAKINEQSLANATKVKKHNNNFDGDMGGAGMLDDDFGGGAGDIEDKLNAE